MRNSHENLLKSAHWTNLAAEQLSEKPSAITQKQLAFLIRDGILRISDSPIIPDYTLKREGPLHDEFRFLRQVGKIREGVRWESVQKSFDRELIAEILSKPQAYQLNEFNYAMSE
ncbi:hypothetical protein WDW89_10065 [Deltaproteobacteria bacterium TL4]